MASQLGSETPAGERASPGLGHRSGHRQRRRHGAPVNPIKSREVCDAVKGDAPEAARKRGGWVGKRKRNTGRKGGGWLSETPRVVDDERTGPGGFKPTRNPERGIFTHLPRTENEALSGLIHLQNLTTTDEFHRRLFVETKRYRFLMVMMTHAASCRDSTSCAVWKCDSAKRHLRHARGCGHAAQIALPARRSHHHRRECADGDGCHVRGGARAGKYGVHRHRRRRRRRRGEGRGRGRGRGGGRGRGRGGGGGLRRTVR